MGFANRQLRLRMTEAPIVNITAWTDAQIMALPDGQAVCFENQGHLSMGTAAMVKALLFVVRITRPEGVTVH